MRQILETEGYVEIPAVVYSDPFYRITYFIKEEIRKYKWIEGEKGRKLSWEEARQEGRTPIERSMKNSYSRLFLSLSRRLRRNHVK